MLKSRYCNREHKLQRSDFLPELGLDSLRLKSDQQDWDRAGVSA